LENFKNSNMQGGVGKISEME